ncbi:MAG TPA: YciI family protein [Planctomycetota bacterium]|nr:YciI family protein [Planctomycetota bacterium]
MRYVVMHKAGPDDEAGVPPPPKLIQEMQQLIGEACKAGFFLTGEGLKPGSKRLRLRGRDGDGTVTRGLVPGGSHLPAAFAAIAVRDQDAAIEWGKRFAAAIGGDVDLEIGPLVEPWDIGAPKPEGVLPARFLVIQNTSAATESGAASSPASRAAVGKLMADSTKDGVLQFFETLQPTSRARRLHYQDNERRVVDGPFAESKELVGGFCMMQMRSIDEVSEWANRYARIIGGTCEIDVRPVAEPNANAPSRGAR